MAVSDLLQKIINVSENKLATIVSNGTSGDINKYIDTGCYLLNAQLSGDIYKGIPINRNTAFVGKESTGKTYAVASIVSNFIKNEQDATVIWFDTENAVSKDFFENKGVDSSRIAIFPVGCLQEFRTQIVKILDSLNEEKKVNAMIVLDSLGMLASSKEINDAASGEDKQDMTRAKTIRSIFRIISTKLMIHKIPMLITNHTYETMDMYGEDAIAGGGGLKYAASIICMLSKAQIKESDGTISGVTLTNKLIKGRLSKEKTKVKLLLSYSKGLHPYSGLVDIAEQAGIWVKTGNRYNVDDNKLYEKEIMKNASTYFNKEVLDKINEYCHTLFDYGANVDDDNIIENEQDEDVIVEEKNNKKKKKEKKNIVEKDEEVESIFNS
jgi:RecA/RadA recombinase